MMPKATTERPLEQRRVVVTRPAGQSENLIALLHAAGAEVISLPLIVIEPPRSWQPLDGAFKKMADGLYSWVLFTSANAVNSFFDRLRGAGRDARSLRAKVGVVGRATARALDRRGIVADLVPEKFTGAELAHALGHGSGSILLPRATHAPPDIVEVLERQGWMIDEVPAYTTRPVSKSSQEAARVRAGDFDVLTFASASAAGAFVALIARPEQLGLSDFTTVDRLVGCIGPVTAAAATELGFRIDIVAEEHTDEGLVAAIAERLGTVADANIER